MVRSESETSIIYLVGMPGSGKTTIGRQLAFKLGYDFLDLDYVIEQKASQTIPEIFSEKGETFFRELEKEVVLESIKNKNIVIATGGGAPCFFDNMKLMNENGKTVFIDVSAEELCNRIWGNGQTNRPMLKDKTKEELLDEISAKIEARRPFYSLADFTIQNDFASSLDFVDLLHKKINETKHQG